MSTQLASATQTRTELPRRVRVSLHSVDLWVFVGDMPALMQQPNCLIYWKLSELIQVADNIWFHPHGISVNDLLLASGHNPRKIDYAVPQEWYDLPEVKAQRDTKDKPMWSYEKAYLWGEPLWMSEVYEDLKREILSVLPAGI